MDFPHRVISSKAEGMFEESLRGWGSSRSNLGTAAKQV